MWRLRVAGRILAAYVLTMVAYATTLGWSVVAERSAARDVETLSTGYVPLKLALGGALEAQNLLALQLNHITEIKNPSDARNWIETQRRLRPITFSEVRASITTGLSPSGGVTGRDHDEDLAAGLLDEGEQIERWISQDGQRFAWLFEAMRLGETDRAETLQNELISHEVEGARRIREMIHRVDREMDRVISTARRRVRMAIGSLVALAATTLLVGMFVSLYTRRVLRPLAAVTERAQAVAHGDLSPREIPPARDEIGELAVTFDGMVGAIAKAHRDLVQAERLAAIGKMAAHVTHEIRNPLSSMGLNVELLEEELTRGGDPREGQQLLREVKREIDRLADLSEQYLSLARSPVPRLERDDLGDWLHEVLDFVRPELLRSHAHATLDVTADLPMVLFDEAQMRQALLNLIRNAREAMQPAGGILELSVSSASPDWVDLLVDDSGSGIPLDARPQIFDPFFTTKHRGTGLGLSMTRQIIEAHGGTIRYEARSPRGTRFHIRLPTSHKSLALPDRSQTA